jgi:hypothetical protein
MHPNKVKPISKFLKKSTLHFKTVMVPLFMNKNHFQEGPFKIGQHALFYIKHYVGLGFENTPFKIRGE